MKDDRLLEIASTISKLDGPLVVMGYLTSLRESEMYLFFNYVKDSRYGSLDFYKAVKMFCDDYVKDKEISVDNSILKEFGYTTGTIDYSQYDYGFSSDYLDQYASVDNSVKINNNKGR